MNTLLIALAVGSSIMISIAMMTEPEFLYKIIKNITLKNSTISLFFLSEFCCFVKGIINEEPISYILYVFIKILIFFIVIVFLVYVFNKFFDNVKIK